MGKNIFVIFLLTLLLFSSCKKTESDIQWEEALTGHSWEPRTNANARIYYMPILEFGEDNRGKSYLTTNSTVNEFGWEIRQKQMRLYYDEAPSEYSIGQDKYNSKAIFRVNSLKDSVLDVSHLTSTGYEVNYKFYKIK